MEREKKRKKVRRKKRKKERSNKHTNKPKREDSGDLGAKWKRMKKNTET